MTTDTLSALLTNLKNAAAIGRDRSTVPYSSVTLKAAELLTRIGYLRSAEKIGKKNAAPHIEAYIAFENGAPKVQGARRVSKLSRRIYKGYAELSPVKGGHGTAVLSTPSGLLTDKEARTKKSGGEVLFEIW